VLDRTALDHAQVLNVGDVVALLPGGKSPLRQELTADERLLLRSGSAEKGNASFGAAIEVDGVRLGNNASFEETRGVDVRGVGSANIESVEVVTGIPSVEHGDLGSGLVSFRTKRGRTPWLVTLSSTPNNKLVAVSKGFGLGSLGGTVNVGVEHTRSVSDPASPFTSYVRNGGSVRFAHTVNGGAGRPLAVEVGFSGNLGGYDSKADPDVFVDTYERVRGDHGRGNFSLRWLLNGVLVTNLELGGAVVFSNRSSRRNVNRSSSSSQPAIHSVEQGYFIASRYEEDPGAAVLLLAPGSWYELGLVDDKPVDYRGRLKVDRSWRWGVASGRLMLGGEVDCTGNRGRGAYFDVMRLAPTWREYRYDERPFMNNVAWYVEESLRVPVGGRGVMVELMGGLREDLTLIRGSEYGVVRSLSPRFNGKVTFLEGVDGVVRDLYVYGGWGKAVKLPSFEILFPRPVYADDLAFAPGAMADGTTFYAYFTMPGGTVYNPGLRWQHSEQVELGGKMGIGGVQVGVSFFRNRTFDPYICMREYVPYSYKLTDQRALEGVAIPSGDRGYSIDRETGVVTVFDRRGLLESRELDYLVREDYSSNLVYGNGSPVERRGVEWVVDLPQIPSVRTSFRLDGNFYDYKGVDETVIAWRPSSRMTDNSPFRFVGYYVGSGTNTTSSAASASVSNGSVSRSVDMNLMTETHFPKIRMIFTLKVEASLYQYSRRLSEYGGESHGFASETAENLFGEDGDIYQGDVYVVNYPLYYTAWDDPATRVPFAEKFVWAREHDRELYNELAKMVVKSNTNYFFNPNRISPYFSANINITKEIGKFASISFYANNFFNNMAKVKASNNRTESTLYNSSYIPRFSYGLSLRLKL
jgi:hypothetical protein